MRYAQLGSIGPDILRALLDYRGATQDLENFPRQSLGLDRMPEQGHSDGRPDGSLTADDVKGAHGVLRLLLKMSAEESIRDPGPYDSSGGGRGDL
jgi:hypothetical protein